MYFNCNIILASNSPRRKELLKFIFNDFDIIASNIDEKNIENSFKSQNFTNNIEKFSTICSAIAHEKCNAVSQNNKDSLVISADTIVYDDNNLFGKPKNKEEAIYMLEYLSGKTHIVQTSFSIYYKNKIYDFSEKSYVTFNELTETQKQNIKSYVEKYKPFDKSGSYGIQDKDNYLIKDFNGDLFNIVGLPITTLFKELYKISKL